MFGNKRAAKTASGHNKLVGIAIRRQCSHPNYTGGVRGMITQHWSILQPGMDDPRFGAVNMSD